MYKKLLGLLPLVWLAVLAHHLTNSGTSISATSQTPGTDPSFHSQFGVFYKSHPHAVPIFLSLGGRSIESITVDGPLQGYLPGHNSDTRVAGPSKSLHGQPLEYCYIPHSTSFNSSTVVLTPTGLSQLSMGLQRIRFTLSDHSSMDYSLIVCGDKEPSRPSYPHCDRQANRDQTKSPHLAKADLRHPGGYRLELGADAPHTATL